MGVYFLKNIGATKAVASTFGVLVGLAGIEHGFFEMLQGNVTPSGGVQKNKPGIYDARDWNAIRSWAKELAQKART